MTPIAIGGSTSTIRNGESTIYKPGHADSQLDHDDSVSAELYLVMFILSLFSVAGSAGNTIVLYVYHKKQDKVVATLLILSLALVDLVTCLFVIPYTIYMEYVNYKVGYDIVCKLYQFLITSNVPFSALIMSVIAVDRYLCICKPFAEAMTMPRAKVIVAVLTAFATALGLCVSLMHGVNQLVAQQPTRNTTAALLILRERIADAVNQSESGALRQSVASRQTGALRQSDVLPPSRNATYINNVDSDRYDNKAQYLYEFTFSSSSGKTTLTDKEPVYRLQYTGYCWTTEEIFSFQFQTLFQRFYTALYLASLTIVIALYVMIYRSVVKRRNRRQSQRSGNQYLIPLTTTVSNAVPVLDGAINAGLRRSEDFRENTGDTKTYGASVLVVLAHDRNRIANLKTAAMLFVVTVVFVVSFVPAFLMALDLIPYNIVVFYMYFANNVANPVIYSFMNKQFRDNTRRIFRRL